MLIKSLLKSYEAAEEERAALIQATVEPPAPVANKQAPVPEVASVDDNGPEDDDEGNEDAGPGLGSDDLVLSFSSSRSRMRFTMAMPCRSLQTSSRRQLCGARQ